MNALENERNELLKQIAQIKNLRRGQLSEQYYQRRNQSGKTVKTGPYFVWQAWVNNKKRSIRVKTSDAEAVRADTENYQMLKRLFDRLAEVTEEITLSNERPESKKKPKKRGKVQQKK